MVIDLSFDMLALIGIIVLAGFMAGRLARRFGIPQVVGYIITGLVLGPTVLHVVTVKMATKDLDFIKELALGVIGFEMGLHLHFPVLRRLGKSIVSIVIFQALLPFTLVAVGVALLTQGNIAAGLLLGVLATATAPAATMEVLEEYDSEGPLTTSIVAVVGIDDAVALIIFSLIVPLVESGFTNQVQAPTLLEILEVPFFEIGGSIFLGALIGVPLAYYINENCHDRAAQVATAAGAIFLCAGLSETWHLSLILTTMTMGVIISNLVSDAVECVREIVEQVGPILYILFFALVGARFEVMEVLVDSAALILGAAYMIARIVGKVSGSWLGSLISGADQVVRKNIGMALLSQGGVAIGLALSIDDRFRAYGEEGAALGALVITVITATTFVMEIVGPILVKVAIGRADEIDKRHRTDLAAADDAGAA